MGRIQELIQKEEKRQRETLMMIPSENYTYPEVLDAVGSVLMHKYAEGQVGKRYYQGNSIVDEVESYCKALALRAFGLSDEKWSANVQPHSGCPANLAVYNALLSPGDKILSMYLPDGGHLSHGWEYKGKKITLVSKIYNVAFYHVDPETQVFDYSEIAKQAKKIRPKLIISGGTAYPREIDHKKMSEIAINVGAYYMADIAHEAGLVIGGANKSPFPHADVVTFTTHKTLRGPRGAVIISKKQLGEKIDRSVFPGMQGGPHMHSIAGIAIALSKSKGKKFRDYATRTVKNARVLAEELTRLGFDLISGGTDKHLLLIDLRNKKISGKEAAVLLEEIHIIVNANTIPNDPNPPLAPSGLRLGTQALTVRGMREKEMKKIAGWINEVIINHSPADKIKKEVMNLLLQYPMYE